MSRIWRVRRRPDHWATSHDRARARAAERLDGPLGATESSWLDAHLAECPTCRTTAMAYEADRQALRAMRASTLVPPRDLWARTSAAIEREGAVHGAATPGSGPDRAPGSVRRSPLAQWGAIAGISVVAVVVGTSVLSGGWLGSGGTAVVVPGTGAPASSPAPAATDVALGPFATPIAVDAGTVRWLRSGLDGGYAYTIADINEVCAQSDEASCATLDDGQVERITLAGAPRSIISSPSDGQAVLVGADGSGGDQVVIMSLPEPDPTEAPATAAPDPTATPAVTATATSAVTAPPSADPAPTATPTATATADVEPTPEVTPSPTAAALAIISGVTVVGDAAAFSPDGSWFAFTARPADGSAGPDIYAWRVGDAEAVAVTDDHRSAFGSWSGDLIIGSRADVAAADPAAVDATDAAAADPAASDPAAVDPAAVDAAAITFQIDPATGTETALAVAGWRPALDATGTFAIFWDGSVFVGADHHVTPAEGRLVLVPWADAVLNGISPDAPVIAEGPISDFTVRWDETGTWFAVSLVDGTDPMIERLSLMHIDASTGTVDRPEAGPHDVPALAGFSIRDGRLAWATPPRQDGEGSRIQIVAWTADGVGSTESAPGQDVVVIR